MASISFSQIFFAIAMLFLGTGKAAKITITMDGNAAMVWVLQADGQWHCTDNSKTVGTDAGFWSYDGAKQTITIKPPTAGAEPQTVAIASLYKASPEKPEPATVDIAGRTFIATRTGDDIALTPKEPTKDGKQHTILIRFEQAAVTGSGTSAPVAP